MTTAQQYAIQKLKYDPNEDWTQLSIADKLGITERAVRKRIAKWKANLELLQEPKEASEEPKSDNATGTNRNQNRNKEQELSERHVLALEKIARLLELALLPQTGTKQEPKEVLSQEPTGTKTGTFVERGDNGGIGNSLEYSILDNNILTSILNTELNSNTQDIYAGAKEQEPELLTGTGTNSRENLGSSNYSKKSNSSKAKKEKADKIPKPKESDKPYHERSLISRSHHWCMLVWIKHVEVFSKNKPVWLKRYASHMDEFLGNLQNFFERPEYHESFMKSQDALQPFVVQISTQVTLGLTTIENPEKGLTPAQLALQSDLEARAFISCFALWMQRKSEKDVFYDTAYDFQLLTKKFPEITKNIEDDKPNNKNGRRIIDLTNPGKRSQVSATNGEVPSESIPSRGERIQENIQRLAELAEIEQERSRSRAAKAAL